MNWSVIRGEAIRGDGGSITGVGEERNGCVGGSMCTGLGVTVGRAGLLLLVLLLLSLLLSLLLALFVSWG